MNKNHYHKIKKIKKKLFNSTLSAVFQLKMPVLIKLRYQEIFDRIFGDA